MSKLLSIEMQTELKINPEYETIVPPQTNKEYEELKKSIAERGQYNSIAYNEDFEVLDGHHRFKAMKELGLKIRMEALPRKFASKLHEKLFVIDTNLQRRQLTPYVRIDLALKKEPILKAIAKGHMSLGGQGLPISATLVNVREDIAKDARVGHNQVDQVKVIKQFADEETKQRLIAGDSTINKEYQEIIRDKKEEEYNKQRQEELALIPKEDINHTICGDFKEIEISDQIEDDSVNLIFTDPPYDEKSLSLYTTLGEFASKKLKKGGSLVAYAGHFLIDQVIGEIKKSPDLEFWWVMAEFHGTEGAHTMMRKQNITVSWKPLVWFVKRGREPTNIIRQHMFADSVKSIAPENEKLGHKWEQSLTTPNYIIQHLTDEQDFIVDPMCGSGTTLVSAIKLNRRCKGIDTEQKHLDESEARIKEVGK